MCYPHLQKGDKGYSISYRLISLTCKVMEHVVASSLSKHRESNKVLYDLQYGLREKKSHETQVVQLVEELARNTSQGH